MSESVTTSAEDTPETAEEQERRYWLYVPGEGAGKWEEFQTAGIMALNWDRIGDPTRYPNEEAIIEALESSYGDWGGRPRGAARMIRDFAHTIRPGDVVYARRTPTEIIGRGIVRSGFRYDDVRSSYRCVRDVEWTHIGSWTLDRRVGAVTLQRVTENTSYNPAQLESLFREREELAPSPDSIQAPGAEDADRVSGDVVDLYTRENFLEEVFLDPEDLEQMLGLLRRKKNLILQGAPGAGKTFAAKRLAYALMGQVDDSRVEMVQFHQSTAYEDVVVGLRPTSEGGFAAVEGVFARFCRRAAAEPGRDYVFIIDEINRANISKAFGELLMLIEAEHRGDALRLPVSGELLAVPERLHLIGMMNTADRGLALIDYALRRRFAFFEMKPALDHPGFLRHVAAVGSPRLEALVDVVRRLNQRIIEDETLGPGFQIGHSYLCLPPRGSGSAEGAADADVASVVRYELEPLVREYWFDNRAAMEESIHQLESVLL
ncbi:AAA family ATPase [Actinomyces sp. ZJ308]|uniref:McrB family protein n=1 Tax=Actinomyces sp. ZJ308 TaxID=2708342 RepID=UPI00141D820C|nr:AAA family ATPase [Actinomyces sp. ZJ308]